MLLKPYDKMKKISFLMAACAFVLAGCTPKEVAPAASQSLVVEDGGTGPYKVLMLEDPSLEAHTIFAPQNEKPYRGPQSTSAQQIEAIEWAIAQNADKESPYYGRIDTDAIAAAGMSCGGLQTLDNSADPRLKTIMICNSGLFINPAGAVPGMPMPEKEKLQNIKVPVIYILGGETDIAYLNGMDDFHRLEKVPAFAANYPVGHGGTYRQEHGGEFTVPALAWLQWQLKGDKEAAKMFQGTPCGLSQREGWTVEKNALID